MRDDRDCGGPAFPDPCPNEDGFPGMQLRDWLAGQAITNVVTADDLQGCVVDDSISERCKVVAKIAYMLADAMLQERRKGGE